MRLALTGRHVEITPAIRRLVDGKLARLDRMLNDSALSAQVVLSKEKNGYGAEVTLHARGEKFLHGAGKADGLPGCLGGAVDKISHQALKVKGKWQERKRRGVVKGEAVVIVDPAAAFEAPSANARAAVKPVAARPRMPRIMRSSRQALRAMSVADAARSLDGGEGVIIFRDLETTLVSVLYRAGSGELTLVETEA